MGWLSLFVSVSEPKGSWSVLSFHLSCISFKCPWDTQILPVTHRYQFCHQPNWYFIFLSINPQQFQVWKMQLKRALVTMKVQDLIGLQRAIHSFTNFWLRNHIGYRSQIYLYTALPQFIRGRFYKTDRNVIVFFTIKFTSWIPLAGKLL